MGALSLVTLLLTHPFEFRTLVQYKLWHESNRDITAPAEHKFSGWDRTAMRRCWELLDMTSRSFATVVKEPEGDLSRVICLFYLVLRALDTVEDDMTLPNEKKLPILRSFYKLSCQPGWTFTESGPNEKDRQLLVEYNVVIEELLLVEDHYREVIVDIARQMGAGMADYAQKAASSGRISVETVSDYDLYCHYVAGLVGEGLTRLIAASDKETAWISSQLDLANSMGLFLQKTNIIRDFREDADDHRYFWPRELWANEKYALACGRQSFSQLEDMFQPGNEQHAMWVLSGMIADALSHALDCLHYLRLIRRQGVFNFCAIPQTMAIATLELCFMNPLVFKQNIKIRKAAAADLIMRSKNPRDVAYIFRDYARKIHTKAVPYDPNFMQIAVVCGQIEQWCEHYYPSFVQMSESGAQVLDPSDARAVIVQLNDKKDTERKHEKRMLELREKFGTKGGANGGAPAVVVQPSSQFDMMLFVGAAFALVFAVGAGAFWILIKLIPDES